MSIKTLIDRTRTDHAPALGIADEGNMFGALEFSETAAAAGIQPIIGCTLPILWDQSDKTAPAIALLCCDETGYHNLIRLTSLLNSPEATTAIPIELIEKHQQGLILLSGGDDGLSPLHHQAETRFRHLQEIFGDRFYIELQRYPGNLDPHAHAREAAALKLADKLNIALVATNDPFFADPDDHEAHHVLLCIGAATTYHAESSLACSPHRWLKSPELMVELFANIPEAIHNSVEIARRCRFRPRACAPILPLFNPTDDAANDAEADKNQLRDTAARGLETRLNTLKQHDSLAQSEQAYRQRLDYELDIITSMQFSGYFLIVADFIAWAKQQTIPIGPGRGSGAASIVSWSLGITDLDPLRFNLIFERFLNPERISMPDFDIDFCQDRRGEVLDYIRTRYRHDRIAQIITFGSLQSRAVLRDVGRVLSLAYAKVDQLCQNVPVKGAIPVKLGEALNDKSSRLAEDARQDPEIERLLNIALKLEGLYRHPSTHAAGIVIGNQPLLNIIPLYHDPRSDPDSLAITQFTMKWVERAGLIKFDLLGLKTLSVIHRTLELAHSETSPPPNDPSKIPLDDPATYKLICDRAIMGVFQLEGSGMNDVIRDLQPDRFEDLIALIALYRPGPMENIPLYINRKFERQKRDYLHPLLEPVLNETYGVIVYQEQVLQIAQTLSGYSLGEADLLRRAMGKKQPAEMAAQKKRFIDGAVSKKIDTAKATHIFDLVSRFAGYGFNKAHATCYALLTYQTAWLKTHYPLAFFAASMHYDSANSDRLQAWKSEMLRSRVEILPPCYRRSGVSFSVENKAVRYALSALRHVGSDAAQHVAEFKDAPAPTNIQALVKLLDPSRITRNGLQSMIRAGTFDSLEPNRARLDAAADSILRTARHYREECHTNQNNLFDALPAQIEVSGLPEIPPWSQLKTVTYERDVAGFYLSGHPLDSNIAALKSLGITTYRDFDPTATNATARLAGAVIKYKERKTRNGDYLGEVELSDRSGHYQITVFDEMLETARPYLKSGQVVVLDVAAIGTGIQRLHLKAIRFLDDVISSRPDSVKIHILNEEHLKTIAQILNPHPAQANGTIVDLVIYINDSHQNVSVRLPQRYAWTPAFAASITHLNQYRQIRAA